MASILLTKSLAILIIAVMQIGEVHSNNVLKFESESKIKKVHVIFMNHLDVGYYSGRDEDPGYAITVINEYLNVYLERAVNMSQTLIDHGYVERFIYTTHPWLLSLFFDCPENITLIGYPLMCPNETSKATVAKAIQKGQIAWHASPMNFYTDNMGAQLFDYGLSIGEDLDKRFGIKRTHATMSQRDVPGMTKALIPILLKHGIKAVSVGVNPGTAPPDVPDVFVWKYSDNDTDGVIGFWDKGGYPVNVGPYPADPKGLAKKRCLVLDGLLDEALCFAFRTDNTGPPVAVEEILNAYDILRAEFPGAELVASTFDNFVQLLEPLKAKFPVRTHEIGDTWVQGVGTDPVKIAKYNAFEFLWEDCMNTGECSLKDPRIQKMLQLLIKLPEHTWGVHNFLDDKSWTNEELAHARLTDPKFNLTEASWYEQRQFLDYALQALGDHPLRRKIESAYKYMNIQTQVPDLSKYKPVDSSKDYTCPNKVVLKFSSDGSLSRLYDPFNRVEWASEQSRLAQFTYDTYIEDDFIQMAKQYNYEAGVGYDKPNVTQYAHPEKKRWDLKLVKLYRNTDLQDCNFWAEVKFVDSQTRTKYGAPETVYINYISGKDKNVKVNVLMVNKTPTRLPESLSVQFAPVSHNDHWTLYKMGLPIDPCHVVLNGSQYCHAVDKKLTFTDKTGGGLILNTLNTPVVFIGTTDHVTQPFPVPLQPFPCSTINAIAFNIYNNIWNTNFIFWYPYDKQDANFMSQFVIEFKTK